MHDKIKNHVEMLLGPAPDCPEKKEIAEEMSLNLTEKYDDLVSQGRDSDDAYREVVAGIGDVSEIISFIRSARDVRQNERSTPDSPFSGFEERVRTWGDQLARSIEEPMRNMADEIKAAAKKAESSAKSFRGARYDYTFSADGISALLIEMRSGDLTLGISEDENIHVVERSQAELNEQQRASFNRSGDCLRISQGRNYVGFFFFGFGIISSNLEVYLPECTWRSIIASGVMDVNVDGLDCQSLSLKSSSGDMNLNRLRVQSLIIESISGDIDLAGDVEALDIRNKSGDINLHGVNIGSFSADLISGDIVLDGSLRRAALKGKSGDTRISTATPLEALNIETISGDVRLSLPENDGFSIKYKRVSGDLRSDFNLMTSLNSRDGLAVYKEGCEPPYIISTASGDIHITRRR